MLQIVDEKLNLDFVWIKDQFQHFDIPKAEYKEYLLNNYYKAFSLLVTNKDKRADANLVKYKALTKLAVFFILRLDNFVWQAPKDNFTTIILDIAEDYENMASQINLSTALTGILLECLNSNINIQTSLQTLLNEFISNMNTDAFSLNGDENVQHGRLQQIENEDLEKEQWIAENGNVEFLDKTGKKQSYQKFKASNVDKLNVLINANACYFKNEQVRQRKIEAFKRLNAIK